jgi:hypothetical protein
VVGTGQSCADINNQVFGGENVLKQFTASGYTSATSNVAICIPRWAEGCLLPEGPGYCNTWVAKCVDSDLYAVNRANGKAQVCSVEHYMTPIAGVRAIAIPIIWWLLFTAILFALIIRGKVWGNGALALLATITALALWVFGTIILFSPYMYGAFFAYFFALVLVAVMGSSIGGRYIPAIFAFLVLTTLLLIQWGETNQRENGGAFSHYIREQDCINFYSDCSAITDLVGCSRQPGCQFTNGVCGTSNGFFGWNRRVSGEAHNPLKVGRHQCHRGTLAAMLFFFELVLACIAVGAATMLAAIGSDLYRRHRQEDAAYKGVPVASTVPAGSVPVGTVPQKAAF